MKKKLLALLLSGAMILTLTTPAAFAEEPEGECCGACGQVECVCPPEEAPCEVCGEIECVCPHEEAPCEVCGEIECVCEKIEELPEEEVPGAAAPEIPEEPTVCEICGEIECVCEKIEAPEVPETSEEPTEEDMSLFERLMACETLDEIWEIFDASSEEQILALTDEEHAQIGEKIAELEPEPLPAIVIEEESETVVSEIVSPTVSFTEVAPLADPVAGEAE